MMFQLLHSTWTLFNLFPVCLERIKAYSVSVWQTAEEGTAELNELDSEQDDAKECVHLRDLGLPEGEVDSQILSRHGEDKDPEHDRDLLVKVVLLPQIQPGWLEPTESQQQETFVEKCQSIWKCQEWIILVIDYKADRGMPYRNLEHRATSWQGRMPPCRRRMWWRTCWGRARFQMLTGDPCSMSKMWWWW